jgi:4'-phosphopantetheinyl transferase
VSFTKLKPQIVFLGQADLKGARAPLLDGDAVHVWALRSSALTEILSLYTGIEPSLIQFEKTGLGKPRLLPPQNPGSLYFNRSHSGDLEVVALTRRGEIGVDIEEIRVFVRMDAFLKRFAFASERARIETLPASERLRAFFELWTAKEAWCKAQAKSIFNALEHYEWDPLDPGFLKLEIEAGYVGYLYLQDS